MGLVVAVDAVAGYLMGFDPTRIVYLRIAAELGIHDLNRLRIYTVRDGAVAPCRELDAWRAVPTFRVISSLVDEALWDISE